MADSNTPEANSGLTILHPKQQPDPESVPRLGSDVLLLARFTGREAISEPFEFKVTMYSQNAAIVAGDVLRKSATISIHISDTDTRYFNGIFRDFMQGGFDQRSALYTYEATIVPSLWLLSLGWNCKIFQNMSFPISFSKSCQTMALQTTMSR